MTTAIGLAAAFCTTVAFLPQAIKTWKTRSTADLSLGMFSLFFAGVVLWLSYGFLIDDLPIIMANTVTLVLAGYILGQLLVNRYRAANSGDTAPS